jgi:hypothetical protein
LRRAPAPAAHGGSLSCAAPPGNMAACLSSRGNGECRDPGCSRSLEGLDRPRAQAANAARRVPAPRATCRRRSASQLRASGSTTCRRSAASRSPSCACARALPLAGARRAARCRAPRRSRALMEGGRARAVRAAHAAQSCCCSPPREGARAPGCAAGACLHERSAAAPPAAPRRRRARAGAGRARRRTRIGGRAAAAPRPAAPPRPPAAQPAGRAGRTGMRS